MIMQYRVPPLPKKKTKTRTTTTKKPWRNVKRSMVLQYQNYEEVPIVLLSLTKPHKQQRIVDW